ncbi:hypothetical protein VNO77_39038 [Canavalia gladiata]|uniref:Uncharacterized protein n=1 Tax=Canavalia gladiata TaxID=3824 RepID=A0AAN9PXV6_CANGL
MFASLRHCPNTLSTITAYAENLSKVLEKVLLRSHFSHVEVRDSSWVALCYGVYIPVTTISDFRDPRALSSPLGLILFFVNSSARLVASVNLS